MMVKKLSSIYRSLLLTFTLDADIAYRLSLICLNDCFERYTTVKLWRFEFTHMARNILLCFGCIWIHILLEDSIIHLWLISSGSEISTTKWFPKRIRQIYLKDWSNEMYCIEWFHKDSKCFRMCLYTYIY